MHGDMELVTIERANLWLCSLMLVISYLRLCRGELRRGPVVVLGAFGPTRDLVTWKPANLGRPELENCLLLQDIFCT
jgi:hypothetical protein